MATLLTLQAPLVLCDCCAHMGCVDEADIFMLLYQLNPKSHKWRHQMFFHFMDITVVSLPLYQHPPLKEKIKVKSFKVYATAALICTAGMLSQRDSEQTVASAPR